MRYPDRAYVLLAFFLLAGCNPDANDVAASESPPSDEQLRHEEKKAEKWFVDGGWIEDYDEARKAAKRTGKLILAYFTRSFVSCPGCHWMESGPLSQEGVSDLANKAVLFCHITTGIKDRKHDGLSREKGFVTWPSLAVLDADGNVLTNKIERTVDAMSCAIDNAVAFCDLKQRSSRGEPKLEGELFLTELRLSRLDIEEAKRRFDEHELTDAQKKEADSIILRQELMEWRGSLRSRPTAASSAVYAKAYAAYRAGRRPDEHDLAQSLFWGCLLSGAEQANDLAAFEEAYQRVTLQVREDWAKQIASVPGSQKIILRSARDRHLAGLEGRFKAMRAK